MLRLRGTATRRRMDMSESTTITSDADIWTPESVSEAAEMLAVAYRERTRVRIRGAGTRQHLGHVVDHDVVLSTERLDRIIAWEPDDLTAVVEGGLGVEEFENTLGRSRQTAALPERVGPATVGGVVATGRSGWRRLRYGPIRDRMLEVTLVTGDGRVVTAGGRLVKNVTGYDLPRLAVGSLGSMGLIAQVCMKLWPMPVAAATVRVESADKAIRSTFRPHAVLETTEGVDVYLAGTEREIQEQGAALGGPLVEGHPWPNFPKGATELSLRVPPAAVNEAIALLQKTWLFVAQHGVGEVAIAADEIELSKAKELRAFAESHGGALVVTSTTGVLRTDFDPWGTPPESLTLQRRVIAGFDPARLLNPGLLPGRL